MTALPALRFPAQTRRSRVSSSRLIEWQKQPGLWLGTLNGQIAGTVTRVGVTYRAVDWAGQRVGSYLTLHAAQGAFESIRIADLTGTVYGRSLRSEVIRSSAVGLAIAFTAATAGTVLVNAPF
ncbi:hypothetical protein [Naasia lichenicola]|uniref:Uncharacterized protein n=1 Tax=Naasia lichenicola TaxID=2565933 RepID=A0A4S4FL26_9MICO|nr:hypothetical protein [Naasia lichenicola]THG30015.1 hypothetical protein E6C64_15355 [Naasia lichenicola]